MPSKAKPEKSKLCLPIVQVGDPVLRERAQDVQPSEIQTPEFQELIDQMRETMREAPGVGLAAPQIGRSVRLIVIEDRAEYHDAIEPKRLEEIEREPVPFHVLINPSLALTPMESSIRRHWEGLP